MLQQMVSPKEWDICIIGGGATGLGIAVDAASRGYKTILLEKFDFAKGTSSRSTKLIHGGIRYLQQGRLKFVTDSLKERGLLFKNAPHIVKNQSFIIPNYKIWEQPFYGIGLKLYDWMAGDLALGPSQFLSKQETLKLAPTLNSEGLRGGILYHDGQFDDARLAIHLAMTAADFEATLLNYCSVEGFLKIKNKIVGVVVNDTIENKQYEVKSKVVINATGVFNDDIVKMDNALSVHQITPSQGIHLVFNKEFFPSETALMIPKTEDGRVLFAIPWHNKIIVGTTDTPTNKTDIEPIALNSEVEFILHHVGRYLTKSPTKNDIKSVFAGLRPLLNKKNKTTSTLTRDHRIYISASGLISVAGGKWTTYRKMAEDVLAVAIQQTGLLEKICRTNNVPIHGYKENTDFEKSLYYYGSDEDNIQLLYTTNKELKELIHNELPYTKAEIIWAVQNEMCMTVEDGLSRRTRALFLNANAAIEAAPITAELMADVMGKDEAWKKQEVQNFYLVAKHYLPTTIKT